jgi:hypothetical protein
MSTLRVSLEPHAPTDLRQRVRGHLNTFNVGVTGFAEYHSVSVFLRDEHDEVLGGCLGELWGGGSPYRFSGSLSRSGAGGTGANS